MASFTFSSVGDLFGVGTTVGAYLPNPIPDGTPVTGAAVTTAVVAADGSLVFSGLADGTAYVAYDSGSGKARRFRLPPLVGSGSALPHLLGVGHSWMQGQNATSEQHGMFERVARALGAQMADNISISASRSFTPSTNNQVGDGGWAWVLNQVPVRLRKIDLSGTLQNWGAPYEPRFPAVLHCHGLNDIGQLGASAMRPSKEAHRTIWSRLCASQLWEAENDGTFAFTGTWNSLAFGTDPNGIASVNGYRYTATAGDFAQWTAPVDFEPGKVLAFGFSVRGDDSYSVAISINGTPVNVYFNGQSVAAAVIAGSQVCDPAQVASGYASTNGVVIRLGQPGDGLTINPGDVVRVTLSAFTAGRMRLDYAQVEADPADGPAIFYLQPTQCVDYTNWSGFAHGPAAGSDPMNDASITAAKAVYTSIMPEFGSRMLAIDIDSVINKTVAYFASNKSHLNNRGMSIAAKEIVRQIQASGLLSRVRASRMPSPLWMPVGGPVSGTPAFEGSWVNNGTPYEPLGYRRTLAGRVQIRGAIKSGAVANSTVFHLPNHGANGNYSGGGWTPRGTKQFVTSSGATVTVDNLGAVTITAGGSTVLTILDGIEFDADY